jgi:CheY-like chemotaxis protein
MMREMLRHQVGSWNLPIETAAGPDDALRQLSAAAARGDAFRVCIIDADAPGPGGLELGKTIKSRPAIAQTALLLLVPMADKLDAAELREYGFFGHVLKPVRQSTLYDRLVEAVASARPMPGRSASGPAMEPPAPVEGLSGHILLADDNEVNQIVASGVLKKLGMTCDIVGDGRQAVAAVFARSYHLVLMDCLMPEMDGFEATREIRRREQTDYPGQARRVPIIALTANAMSGDQERCLQAGMDGYVSKPLDPRRLVLAIKALMTPAPQTPAPAACAPADNDQLSEPVAGRATRAMTASAASGDIAASAALGAMHGIGAMGKRTRLPMGHV